MTENEVIKITGNNVTEKEINLKTLYQLVEKFNKGHWGDIQLFEDEENRYSTVIEKVIEEIQQYREIGTIEEFKALKEKNTPMELAEHNFQDEVHHYLCPSCRNIVNCNQNYCEECGQALET